MKNTEFDVNKEGFDFGIIKDNDELMNERRAERLVKDKDKKSLIADPNDPSTWEIL